ncbi:MAG: ABC transporter permease [Acidimicrobiales bacterium]
MIAKLPRILQMAKAFVRMGFLLDISYPLGFVINQVHVLVPVITAFFVGRLITEEGTNVGGDYFTFALIGLASTRILIASLNDLSGELDHAIQQGRLETLLVEPIPWRALPFGLVLWPLTVRWLGTVVLMTVALLLGAGYEWRGIGPAIVLTLLGALASLAIGTMAMSIKVISKRSDPILTMYSLLVNVLSGVVFPVALLPGPLQAMAALLPQTYVISANRHLLMTGGHQLSGPTPVESALFLIVFTVVGMIGAQWVLRRSLDAARRLGVLGGY